MIESSRGRPKRPRLRLRLLRLVALAAVGAALPAPLAGQGAVERGLARVDDVRLLGVEAGDRGDIKKLLKTRERRWFALWSSGPLLRQDFLRSDVETIRLYYARLGFLDAQAQARVEREEGARQADVVFEIREGPRSFVREVRFGPVRVFREEELRRRITMEPGEPFNPAQVGLDRERLLELYADRGHFPIVVARWSRDSSLVTVEFDLDEGPAYHVDDLRIEGVTRVDTVVVQREVLLESGDLFRRSRLQRSIERLYDTGLFQVVDFTPARVDTERAEVDLRITVRERKHRWLEGGVGIGSAEGLRVLGEWGHRNLWGLGRQLSAASRYTFGPLSRFNNTVRYAEPWLFGTRTRGQISAFFEQREVQFRDAPFDQRSWGATLSARREFTRNLRATLALDHLWAEAVNRPDASDSVLVDFEPGFFTRRVSLRLELDERDDLFNPREGQFYDFTGEVAGELLGGQGRFRKGTVSGAWYLPIGRAAGLAARLRAGGVQPFGTVRSPLESVPLQDLYRTGGATSVRGYHEEGIVGADGIGGLMLLVGNLEYRFPVAGILSGAAFVDAGNVWSRPRDFKLDQIVPPSAGELLEANDLKWSVGGGVRVATPVGPIRVDYGYRLYEERSDAQAGRNPPRWGLHVSFGQAF